MPERAEVIQARIYAGYGKAARVVGMPHDLFRPYEPDDPLRLVNLEGVVRAVFDARPSLKFSIPAQHNDAFRYAVVDGTAVQVGDYLVGPKETVFVAGMPDLQSIVCIGCNTKVSLRRTPPDPDFGPIEDRSPDVSSEVRVFHDWPASMLYSGRGGGDDVQLPGDAPPPNWNLLMPPVPTVAPPREGDVMVDALGRRFAVSWCEVSHLGWRMIVRDLVAA